MLWDIYNSTVGSRIVIVADTQDEAIAWAERITGLFLNWSVSPLVVNSSIVQDAAVEAIEKWWGDYCDFADDNYDISDVEFDAVSCRMSDSFDAVYSAWDDDSENASSES
jgi:hypothetical protein